MKLLITLFILASLSACNNNVEETYSGSEVTGEPIHSESTGIVLPPEIDDELHDELAELKPMIQIAMHQNRVMLINLLTGESLSSYELDEEEVVDQVWDLGNGYYAAWGGVPGTFDFDTGDIVPDDFRIIIFDENLNSLETLSYDEKALPMLLFSLLRFVNGELFVYGLAWNENWEDPLTDFLRINVHTAKVETLFEVNQSLELYEFVNIDQILVFDRIIDWTAGRVHTYYGLLDLETGAVQFFKREGFAHRHVDFHDSTMLIAESHATTVVNHEVILFDWENQSSIFIQLEDDESMWARFSYDSNQIVTVNEALSVFRKYDFNGELMIEVPFELPATIEGEEDFEEGDFLDTMYSGFAIYPITDQLYVMHVTRSLFFLRDHHIRFITLP